MDNQGCRMTTRFVTLTVTWMLESSPSNLQSFICNHQSSSSIKIVQRVRHSASRLLFDSLPTIYIRKLIVAILVSNMKAATLIFNIASLLVWKSSYAFTTPTTATMRVSAHRVILPRGIETGSFKSRTCINMSQNVASNERSDEKKGIVSRIKSQLPTWEESQKIAPLALMFFCILFNYTILRDTKDVLMITAPKSGAEVIPFIKTYVNLPVAIVRIFFHVADSEGFSSVLVLDQ